MGKIKCVAIGVMYNGENTKAIGVYNFTQGTLQILSTKKVKDMFNAKELSISNVNLGFFVNQVDFTIGKQEDYPVIREVKGEKNKKSYNIENGCIIYDTKKLEDNKGNVGYNCLFINGNTCKVQKITEKQLVELKKKSDYKCNYDVKKGKVVITVKENSQYFELEEAEQTKMAKGMAVFRGGWYTVTESGLMEKVQGKECNVKEFKLDKGIKMVDGFADCQLIEKVDLTGAVKICRGAFKNCKNLKEVIFSDSLKQIDGQAFSGCGSLKELKLPASVEYLGDNIYMKGTVYLYKRIGISPFGKMVKVVLVGSNKADNEQIKVALFDIKENVIGYEIPVKSVENKQAFRIEKEKVGILDEIYNYDNDTKTVLGGNEPTKQKSEIVIGKTGQGYATIDIKGVIKAQEFDELKMKKLSNGMVAGNEIIPLKNQPKWKTIELKDENSGKVEKGENLGINSKIGNYIAQGNNTLNAYNEKQLEAISEYLSYKSYELLGGKITFDCKSKEIREMYPNLTWQYDGKKAIGGLRTSDNKDWRRCYYGHPTVNHWVVYGVNESGAVEKTFTFGSDCVTQFLGMDEATFNSMVELEEELSDEISKLNGIIGKNKQAEVKEKYAVCYEIIEYLRKKNKMDILGDLRRHIDNFDSVKLPYMDSLVKDIARKLSHGKCYGDEDVELTDYRCLPTINELIKDGDNAKMLYANKTIKLEDGKKIGVHLREVEKFIIYGVVGKVGEIKNLKELDKFILDIKGKIKKEDLEKTEAFIKEFNKIGLKEGKYVLSERYAVNTNMYEIYECNNSKYSYDIEKGYTIDRQDLKNDTVAWGEFLEAVKKDEIRPTKSFADNEFSVYTFTAERTKVKLARGMEKRLQPDTIKKGDTRLLVYGYGEDFKYIRVEMICSGGTFIGNFRDLLGSGRKYTIRFKDKPYYYGENGIFDMGKKGENLYSIDYDEEPKYVNVDIKGTEQFCHNNGTQIRGRVKRFIEANMNTILKEYKKGYAENVANFEEAKKRKEQERINERLEKIKETFKVKQKKAEDVLSKLTNSGICGVMFENNNYNFYVSKDRVICFDLSYNLNAVSMIGDEIEANDHVQNFLKLKQDNYNYEGIRKSVDYSNKYIFGKNNIFETIKDVKDFEKRAESIQGYVKDLFEQERTIDHVDCKSNQVIFYKGKNNNYKVYVENDSKKIINDKEMVSNNNIYFVEPMQEFTGDIKDSKYYKSPDDFEFTKDTKSKDIMKQIEAFEEERKSNKLNGLVEQVKDNVFFKWVNENNKDGETKIISKDGVSMYAVNNEDMIDLVNDKVMVHNKKNYESLDSVKGIRITSIGKVKLINDNGTIWRLDNETKEKIKKDIEAKDKKEKEKASGVMDMVEYIKSHINDIESWTGTKATLYKGIIETVSNMGKVSYKQEYHIKNCYEDCIKKYPRV